MKKNVWLMNHYATDMLFNQGGRHYWFADNLRQQGYSPTVFCANTSHSNGYEIVNTRGKKHIVDTVNQIPFVFVKATPYEGNGVSRVRNMLGFARNLMGVTKKYAQQHGKPDVILASSVHPLTLVAGIFIARRYKVACICEVRDLWPEGIVVYGDLNRNAVFAKLLYRGERWIYKKADALIFTMEGGRDYIIERGWDKEHGGPIDLAKVHYINNGVDVEQFDKNATEFNIEDDDLNNPDIFKVVYAGSIRMVNGIGLLLDAAKLLSDNARVKLLLWGSGEDFEYLQQRCADEHINNVTFKGRVDKKYVAGIVSRADLNILNYQESEVHKYGGSQNKFFEYLAAGKPILSNVRMGYCNITKYSCGSITDNCADATTQAIREYVKMPSEEYQKYCANARTAAAQFDFKTLTDDLIKVIEKVGIK